MSVWDFRADDDPPASDYYRTSTDVWPPLAEMMDRAQAAEPVADPVPSGAETTPQREKSASPCRHRSRLIRGDMELCDDECGAVLGDGRTLAPIVGDESDAPLDPPRDPVTRPAHYALEPEPLDVIEAWGLGYHEGNILKYVARWRAKGGVQDLRKAAEYLRRLIAVAERG